MAKLLLLVAGFLLVYGLLKAYRRGLPKADSSPFSQREKGQGEGGEDMVRCAHCGVHLPKSESILVHGAFFCSEEHRRLH